MKFKITAILFGIVCSTSFACAQRESREIRSGNSEYKDKAYEEAITKYREALEINSDNFAAQYNLGNALYRQAAQTASIKSDSLFSEAIKAYKLAAMMVDTTAENHDPARWAKTQYNIGNCHYQIGERYEKQAEALMQAAQEKMQANELSEDEQKQVQQACQALQRNAKQEYVSARKEYIGALKNNPRDAEARRNLAKVNEKLKPSPGGGSGSNNQDQEQQQQDQQEQPQQEQEQQEQQEQQAQEQEEEDNMDKETAEQILRALEQDEKDTQEKVQETHAPRDRRLEKNW